MYTKVLYIRSYATHRASSLSNSMLTVDLCSVEAAFIFYVETAYLCSVYKLLSSVYASC
jgi:hypothetical protein